MYIYTYIHTKVYGRHIEKDDDDDAMRFTHQINRLVVFCTVVVGVGESKLSVWKLIFLDIFFSGVVWCGGGIDYGGGPVH